jgi:beta-lactamase class A
MRRRTPNLLRWVSLVFILIAIVLLFYELVSYSRDRARLPQSLTIAGVPVGGIDRNQALDRLLQTYSTPIELYYEDQLILLPPGRVDFRIDTEAIFAAAELMRTGDDFWSGFWDYLWGRPGRADRLPLVADYSRAKVEEALADIASRYDEPPTPARPVPGQPVFEPGEPGKVLDVARATELVGEVLMSPSSRTVVLPVYASGSPRPQLATLDTLLGQILEVEGFDGLASFFIEDLRTGEVVHSAYYRNEAFPADPGIAYDAGSTMKIAVAVTFFRYFDLPLDAEAERLLSEMLAFSGNDPADWLMERIDEESGPLKVTETLRELGLTNSFLVAWYHPPPVSLSGAIPKTEANQREDVDTGPNQFNQTTVQDLGTLLSDLYSCAKGGGALLAAFPGEIDPAECRKILDVMAQNKIGVLIEAGVPEGTRVAHKHGWTESPLDMLGDAGVVYSPGGDYIFSAFLWDDPEMLWEPASTLFSKLSRAAYNYFNPPGLGTGAGE